MGPHPEALRVTFSSALLAGLGRYGMPWRQGAGGGSLGFRLWSLFVLCSAAEQQVIIDSPSSLSELMLLFNFLKIH